MDEKARHRTLPARGHPWIDPSRAPLYVLRYPRDRTVDEVVAAHDAVERIYRETQGGLAWVVDASSVMGASALERKAVVASETRLSDVARLRCCGVAIVIPNPIARQLFTAIRWVVPPSYPEQVFPVLSEAERWALSRLDINC